MEQLARYELLYKNTSMFWAEGCPVVLAAHGLTRDNTDNTVIAQCKFENIGDAPIAALMLALRCTSIDGEPLEDTCYTFLDLHQQPGTLFGEKTPIALVNPLTRSYGVTVRKVIFADGGEWAPALPLEMREIGLGTPLADLAPYADTFVREARKATKRNFGQYTHTVACHADCWVCGCGTLNPLGAAECRSCGLNMQEGIEISSLEYLQRAEESYQQELHRRAEQQERERQRQAELEQLRLQEQEKLAALERQKQSVKRKRTALITGGICALVAICFAARLVYTDIVMPAMQYSAAGEQLAEGSYLAAALGFEALADYKDAKAQRDECYYQLGNAALQGALNKAALREAKKSFAECSTENSAVQEKILEAYYGLLQRQVELDPEAVYAHLLGTELEGILEGYRDAGKLFDQCLYTLGLRELEENGFNAFRAAVSYFEGISLENDALHTKCYEALYRYVGNADDWRESSYRAALGNSYVKDRPEFKALLDESYFKTAMQQFERLGYIAAYDSFAAIEGEGYDTAKWMAECVELGYQQLIEQYRTNGWGVSFDLAMFDNCENIEQYRLLCKAATTTGTSALVKLYWQLRELGSFENAAQLCNETKFTEALLHGNRWSSGEYYFSINYSGTSSFYLLTTSFGPQGEYYSINGTVYRTGSDEAGWTNVFRFSFVDKNTLQLYAYRDGRTYTLYK